MFITFCSILSSTRQVVNSSIRLHYYHPVFRGMWWKGWITGRGGEETICGQRSLKLFFFLLKWCNRWYISELFLEVFCVWGEHRPPLEAGHTFKGRGDNSCPCARTRIKAAAIKLHTNPLSALLILSRVQVSSFYSWLKMTRSRVNQSIHLHSQLSGTTL